jgi:hypothetical protein
MKAVDEQVQELLQKGAFVKTEFSSDKFISNIFQVQKKNGKLNFLYSGSISMLKYASVRSADVIKSFF